MGTRPSRERVEHIAELAKLGLTEAEAAMFQQQLSEILAYAERLQELDTSDVPPMTQVGGFDTVMREDEVTPSLSQEQVVANAPDHEGGYIKIKPILS